MFVIIAARTGKKILLAMNIYFRKKRQWTKLMIERRIKSPSSALGRRRASPGSARFKREYNAAWLTSHTSRAQANSSKDPFNPLHLSKKETQYTYIINKKQNTNIIYVFIKKCKNYLVKTVGSSQGTGIWCSKFLALVKMPKGYIRVLVIILRS